MLRVWRIRLLPVGLMENIDIMVNEGPDNINIGVSDLGLFTEQALNNSLFLLIILTLIEIVDNNYYSDKIFLL